MKLTKQAVALTLVLLAISLPAATTAATCRAGAPCQIPGSPAACRGSTCCCLPSAAHRSSLETAARSGDCPGMVATDAGPVALTVTMVPLPVPGILHPVEAGRPITRSRSFALAERPSLHSDPAPDPRLPRAPPSC